MTADDDAGTSPTAVVDALVAAATPGTMSASELERLRRVIAAGESRLALQHAINNPLTALLAEAQMLRLEALTPEQRAAVDRMLELCRRIVGLVRQLDTLATPTEGA